MATLPQLIEEDIRHLDKTLRDFIAKADAMVALIIDKGGFLITHAGDAGDFDLTTIGALASGAFMANQTIAGLVNEPNFNSIYQQGEKTSVLAANVDENCILIVIFKAQTGVGVVKYFIPTAVKRIAKQMVAAHKRNPDGGLDLSVMNLADTEGVFRKKEA
jgi:predicted regulator of Ras-like GTPase activity (Roadblock/LC7/MglB family)